MACGAHGGEVHEMTSGTAGRPLGEIEPATWLLACNDCNCNRLTDKAAWPVARQLALKLLCDFERFDLGKFNACYTLGRIHMEDVLRWLTLA